MLKSYPCECSRSKATVKYWRFEKHLGFCIAIHLAQAPPKALFSDGQRHIGPDKMTGDDKTDKFDCLILLFLKQLGKDFLKRSLF